MKKQANDDMGTSVPPTKKFKLDDGRQNKLKNPLEKSVKPKERNLKSNQNQPEKIEDWIKFKKEKKELKLKRKQARAKDGFDVIVKAKKLGEHLRRKSLKGGEEKRIQLINELHSLLKGKGHYAKFVLAHDTARLVQWLLKFASKFVIQQISQELVPVTFEMMQSKYGIHCVKRLLKYGDANIRSQVINAMLGRAVKLANHAVSSPVLEYAYSTWASPTQKQYLIQEFYGDLYKNSKDPNVKHLRDVYKDDSSLKMATLGATKANLGKVLNKSLVDSGLVQSVAAQYLEECSEDDKKDLIAQFIPHVVVVSNSKDGARVAMRCIWYGTNKDKKVIMKAIKEHVLDLSKHEHGHTVVITLLDSIDDTVLLNKIILSELLNSAKDLAVSEWGRKVLLWLVAPGDQTIFHPVFLKELQEGRETSSCKKSAEVRRKEILDYSISTLLNLIAEDVKFWLKNASLATELSAIVKAGTGDDLEKAYQCIADTVTDLEWKLKENDKDILGIEHPGMHMMLKKLVQSDKSKTFGKILEDKLNNEVLKVWLKLNRGCFLVVSIFENGSKDVQEALKEKLKEHTKVLKKQSTAGAKILMNKIK